MNIKNILFACMVLVMSLPLISSQKRIRKELQKRDANKIKSLKESQEKLEEKMNEVSQQRVSPEKALVMKKEEIVVTQEEIDAVMKMANENEALRLILGTFHTSISREEIIRDYLRDDKKATMDRARRKQKRNKKQNRDIEELAAQCKNL